MIPITAKPSIEANEADALRKAVLSGWVSPGGAVLTCTTGLHLALLAGPPLPFRPGQP